MAGLQHHLYAVKQRIKGAAQTGSSVHAQTALSGPMLRDRARLRLPGARQVAAFVWEGQVDSALFWGGPSSHAAARAASSNKPGIPG